MKNYKILFLIKLFISSVVAENNYPYVFISGTFSKFSLNLEGSSNENYVWRDTVMLLGIEKKSFFTSTDIFGSIHEKACQIYSQLLGLDNLYYGNQYFNDKEYNGEILENRYFLSKVDNDRVFLDNWNENNKIHFITHGIGVQVARWLQHLLRIKFFPEMLENSNMENAIASISSFSGILNGITYVLMLGAQSETGHLIAEKLANFQSVATNVNIIENL